MTVRPNVDVSRLVSTLWFIAIALLVLSLASAGSWFTAVAVAATVGAAGGWLVFALRSRRGLGASLTAEQPPSHAGTINIAHIPVIGIGGLGLVAMAAFVAWYLPQGRVLITWSVIGAIAGSSAFLAWRHFHSGSPFVEHPEETLHLR